MTLEFKLLWVEDEDGFIDAHSDGICDYLDSKGYAPILEEVATFDEIDMRKINSYDLLLIDYHLDDEMSGNQVIHEIRNYNCLTPVVFYSNSPTKEIRGKLNELGLDGVYCSTREGFPKLVEQIIGVTLKKVEDINNLRGLFLAISSDLESTLNRILLSIYNSLDDIGRSRFITYVAEKTCQSAFDENIKNLDLFRKGEIDFQVFVSEHYFYDMAKKICTLMHCLKQSSISSLEIMEKRKILIDFIPEIIKMRNSLAHVVEAIDEQGNPILKGKGIIFNEEKYVEIRKKLKIHIDNLKQIEFLIKS